MVRWAIAPGPVVGQPIMVGELGGGSILLKTARKHREKEEGLECQHPLQEHTPHD